MTKVKIWSILMRKHEVMRLSTEKYDKGKYYRKQKGKINLITVGLANQSNIQEKTIKHSCGCFEQL